VFCSPIPDNLGYLALAYAFIVAAIQTKNTKPQSLHSAVRARPRPRPALSALCKHVWRQCACGCTLGGINVMKREREPELCPTYHNNVVSVVDTKGQ